MKTPMWNKMAEYCPPEELRNGLGHLLQISGMPQNATEHMALLWAVQQPFFPTTFDDGPPDEDGIFTGAEDTMQNVLGYMQETAFSLPYQQGPGATLIEFRPWGTVDGEEPDVFKPQPMRWQSNGPAYLPCKQELPIVITFYYADSMTNIFSSPIYQLENGDFSYGEQ